MEKALEKAVKELKKLVAIPSYEDCTQIQEYLASRLDFIPFQRQEIPKKVNGKTQYNLVYLPEDRPFLINTHVDTVPPIDMEDPFNLKVEGDKLVGRGAADTKGLIAALIVAIDMFKENFPQKQIPVSLAFTVDEENHTALGSQYLVNLLDNVKYSLVLEPTYGLICNKQMGTFEFELVISTPSGHASEFEKFKNPVKEGMKIVDEIEKVLNRPVNIISVNSGWEHYAVPKEAKFLLEVKVYEGENIQEIEKLLKGTVKDKGMLNVVDVEQFLNFGEGFTVSTLKKAYEKALNKKAKLGIMPSWTDAANISKKGVESVVFGFGKLKDAHTNREHITFEELKNNILVFYNLLSILSQPQP